MAWYMEMAAELHSGFGGIGVSVLASGTQDHGVEPGRNGQNFLAKKSTAWFPSDGK
jgi:hypothetical protein